MSKCKQCDRDIAQPKDKYCGACVHNAYAELEAEVARLRSRQEIVELNYKPRHDLLELEIKRLRRENGYMRQFIYRQAKGIPDPNSAYSVMKTLEESDE